MRKLSVQFHAKVGWCGAVKEWCAIKIDGKLMVSFLGVQVEGCDSCF